MKNTIILIGMSGVGKSYHSRIIKRLYGHTLFSIDDMIAKEIGERNVHDIAKFLGTPYEGRYKKNSEQYLTLEEKFTKESLTYAEQNPNTKIIIDTTGSLVHLSKDLLTQLKKYSFTIFLDTNDSLIEEMIERYILEPKPVIWGELYKEFTVQNYKKMLKICYPKLLESRRQAYKTYSQYILPFETHKQKDFDIFEWIKENCR